MISRRNFLKGSIAGGAALTLPVMSLELLAAPSWPALVRPLLEVSSTETLITILHTNDTHSQIDPLPQNDRLNPGTGGVARRATLVKQIRKMNPNTLLIDAGDQFQGTPYFNFFRGEVEYKAMSMIGYDAVTLGNHEFDNGVDALAAAMKFASFDFVSANYDVRGTPLEPRVKPYVVRVLGGVRVGMFGLGVSPANLITPENFKGVKYIDPIKAAEKTVRILRETERCNVVIAMTHLGYYANPREGQVGDTQVAEKVDGIDFIAGGHTHTFMKTPVIVKSPNGKETIVFQVGKSGINVGRVDLKVRNGKVVAFAGKLLDLRESSWVEA